MQRGALHTQGQEEALKVANQGPTEEDKQREIDRITSFMTAQKKDWLIDNFELRKSPFLKDRKDLEKAVEVLLEYWDLFSFDGSYGRTNLIKHRIDLKPGTQVVNDWAFLNCPNGVEKAVQSLEPTWRAWDGARLPCQNTCDRRA